MDRETMLRRVMSLIGITDMQEADQATRVVLLALADTLSPKEAHDMASQLPKEYRDLVMGRLGEPGHTPQKMSWQSLVGRVQSELDLEKPEQAEHVTRSVFTALKEAISPGEIEDILPELPLELQETVRTA